MKVYELKCKECGETWTLLENEFSSVKKQCPFCRSKKVDIIGIR